LNIFTRTAEDIINGVDGSNIKVKFISDDVSYVVRVPNLRSFVGYKTHGGYGIWKAFKISSTTCTKDDLYCKALKLLYDDRAALEKAGEKGTEEYKKLDNLIKGLREKDKTLFGFFDLDSGKPLVIEMSRNQGDAFYLLMKKNESKLDRYAFELCKNNGGVNLLLLPHEDLNEKQKENWEKTKDLEVDFNKIFEKAVFIKDEKYQLQELHKVGFDVRRIGYEPPDVEEEQEEKEQPKPITPNDLPF
jgi:hypothetical protein